MYVIGILFIRRVMIACFNRLVYSTFDHQSVAPRQHLIINSRYGTTELHYQEYNVPRQCNNGMVKQTDLYDLMTQGWYGL